MKFLLHLWNNDIHNAKELHKLTDIPLLTIYRKIKKIKKKDLLKHIKGNGYSKKINANFSYILCQYIRHDTSLSTRILARKLENLSTQVSYRTIERHLASIGYLKKLLKAIPIVD